MDTYSCLCDMLYCFPSDSMLHAGSSEDSDPAFSKLKNPATGCLIYQ